MFFGEVSLSAIYRGLLGMSRRALYGFHTLNLDARFIPHSINQSPTTSPMSPWALKETNNTRA
jgi:hypothetical protein